MLRLPKDIFKSLEINLGFLLYLDAHPFVTTQGLSAVFDLDNNVLYKHMRYWEEQGFIERKAEIGTVGGRHYMYKLSKKAQDKLKEFSKLLSSKAD